MAEDIRHSGVVDEVGEDYVTVKIISQSACGTCQARQACGMAESQEKIVRIPHRGGGFRPGDEVSVSIRKGAGIYAVVMAYVVALVVLVGTLAVAGLLGLSDGVAALAALAAVGAYWFLLWLLRKKIEHTIHFTITKN